MAAARPAAVLISASAMPGATATIEVEPWRPMSLKACMIPQTVPKRPMNGRRGGGGGEEAEPARDPLELDVDRPRQRALEGGERGDAVGPLLAGPLRAPGRS